VKESRLPLEACGMSVGIGPSASTLVHLGLTCSNNVHENVAAQTIAHERERERERDSEVNMGKESAAALQAVIAPRVHCIQLFREQYRSRLYIPPL
jgi:hypothetical protein